VVNVFNREHGSVFGRFELQPFVFNNETVEILGLTFELTQYKRDKDTCGYAPVWVHRGDGGTYLISGIPYLNNVPSLSVHIEYVEDPCFGDERNIAYREHDIGSAHSEEPIRIFGEYRELVKRLASSVLDEYITMIKKHYVELTEGFIDGINVERKPFMFDDLYPYMGNGSMRVGKRLFDLVLEENEEGRHAVWYCICRDENLKIVRDIKVYATPSFSGTYIPVRIYDAHDKEIGYIGHNQPVYSYEAYKAVVSDMITEILSFDEDEEEEKEE
jgi:hypothetical protein